MTAEKQQATWQPYQGREGCECNQLLATQLTRAHWCRSCGSQASREQPFLSRERTLCPMLAWKYLLSLVFSWGCPVVGQQFLSVLLPSGPKSWPPDCILCENVDAVYLLGNFFREISHLAHNRAEKAYGLCKMRNMWTRGPQVGQKPNVKLSFLALISIYSHSCSNF